MEIVDTKVIDIENLKSLENGSYLVMPFDSPSCIYKRLSIPQPYNVCFTVSISSGSGRFFMPFSSSKEVRINTNHENPYTRAENIWIKNRLHISCDAIENSSFENDRYDSYFLLKPDVKLIFHPYLLKRNDLSKLKIKNGEYVGEIFGLEVSLAKWESEEADPLKKAMYTISKIEQAFEIDHQFKEAYFSKISATISRSFDKNLLAKGGVAKTVSRLQPFFENETNLMGVVSYRLAVESSKRTISSVKFSVVFNKIFENVNTQEEFSVKVKEFSKFLEFRSYYEGYDDDKFLTSIIESLPEAREIKKEALKRKSTGAINKIMDDLEFVKIDPEKYPLTHAAIFSGEVPQGTLFRKAGESYFMFNDNWELWEEMLSAYPEEAKQIAATCSGRTTYEKDIMSYFYFVLHKLPEYLEKHTGKKWKGIPKVVNTADELDPPKEGENGVAKTRSALTPIVDNENLTVTVPYVSMSISGGYGTTYCYGRSWEANPKGIWSLRID